LWENTGLYTIRRLAWPSLSGLANCGYLLRCYLTVRKLKEVKEKVIDKLAK